MSNQDLQKQLDDWLDENIAASEFAADKAYTEGGGNYCRGEAFAYKAVKRKVEYLIDISKERENG